MLPVIFLPGIMGSRLKFPAAGGIAWDPDDTLEMMRWWGMALGDSRQLAARLNHQTEARVMRVLADITSERVERGWGGVVRSKYHGLLERLEAQRRTVYAIGYDWRQCLRTTAEQVERRIAELDVPDRFHLVTHSMGGLLARAMLTSGGRLHERVAAVVHLCQPCRGAPVLYRRMFTGWTSRLDEVTWTDNFLGRILGKDQVRFLRNVSGMPGAVQLLPSNRYENSRGLSLLEQPHPIADHVGDVYCNPQSPPGVMAGDAGMLAELTHSMGLTADFHRQICDHYFEETWFIAGDQLRTDESIRFDRGHPDPRQAEVGDGTVPVTSASPLHRPAPALNEMVANPAVAKSGLRRGLQHADAAGDPEVQEAVSAVLRHADS